MALVLRCMHCVFYGGMLQSLRIFIDVYSKTPRVELQNCDKETEMIEVAQISKAYGRRQVLSQISFHIEEGQCVGIAGANGCGKSTLLAILAGAVRPDGGKVLYHGSPADRGRYRKEMGYVPQGNPLLPELSVKDNLKLWYKGSEKEWKREQDSGIIAVLELGPLLKRDAGKLSGGMKRRLSLACALMNHPQFLILDEPGAALDVVCKEEIRQYLSEYLKQGGTVLLTSHEERELSLCGRLLLMRGGRLTEIPADTQAGELAVMITAETR